MPFQSIPPDLIAIGFAPAELGLFAYWFWIYPIRNGLLAAGRSGRSKHWLWLAIHPMFGWPVYWFLRRGTYLTPVGVDTLSKRTRLVLVLAMLAFLVGGLVTAASVGLHPLQVSVLAGMWVAVSGLVIRPLILHQTVGRSVKRLIVLAWLSAPFLLAASAIAFAWPEASVAAKVGAGGGLVLFLLMIASGVKQQRTVYYRGGVIVGQTPWRDVGRFTRVPGGWLAALVMPLLGGIAGLCLQGGRVLGIW